MLACRLLRKKIKVAIIALMATLPFAVSAYAEGGDSVMVRGKAFHISKIPSRNHNFVAHYRYTAAVPSQNFDLSSDVVTGEVEYYNGLGLPTQHIALNAGADNGDVATRHILYNSRGLPSSCLIAASAPGYGAYVDPEMSMMQDYPYLYGEENPICCRTTYAYEQIPSTFLVEQKKAGNDWHASSGERMEYLTNTTYGVLSCRKYVVDNYGIKLCPCHSKGSLRIVRITDEDNHATINFIDWRDSTIMVRKINGTQYLDTHYIYDIYGNLRYILPPELSQSLSSQSSGTIISDYSTLMQQYAFIFRYDDKNRLIYKKVPCNDASQLIYDCHDRIVLSSDGRQSQSNQYTYYLYDRFGRTVVKGLLYDVTSIAQLRSYWQSREAIVEFNGHAGSLYGYTSPFSAAADDVLIANYYDGYQYLDLFYEGQELQYQQKQDYGECYVDTNYNTLSYKGKLTGVLTRVLNDNNDFNLDAFYYDSKGRMIQQRSSNHLGGLDIEYRKLNFAGDPLQIWLEHSTESLGADTICYRYVYDNRGRLAESHIKLGNASEQLFERIGYDALGRMANRLMAGCTTSYEYDAHGWITEISSPYFAQTLHYSRDAQGGTGCLNGDICEMVWTETDNNVFPNPTIHEASYRYAYDGANRLTLATYTDLQRTGGSVGHTTTHVNTNYSTSYHYDRNGNVTSLQRCGPTRQDNSFFGTTVYYGVVDSLTVTLAGNRLKKVKDKAAAILLLGGSMDFDDAADLDTEYTYDANGCLTSDANKGIASIEYNALNLPRRVTMTDGHQVEYTYDALGRKLAAEYKFVTYIPFVSIITGETEYIDTLVSTQQRRDYCANHVYSSSSLERINLPHGYIDSNKNLVAYVRDYQGSNRCVIDWHGVVLSRQAYYPYGLPFASSALSDRYRFGGKEFETASGLYLHDFSARWLANDLPRFTATDPLSVNTPDISPYTYCNANPIRF